MSETYRVLAIEDDIDGQEVLATILAHVNIHCDVAANAAEAEHKLYNEGNRYTAIIIDLALPDKDGWQVLADIQANPNLAGIPCIAVTAYHTSKLRERALEAGFMSYFPKPLEATTFSRQLVQLMS